MQPQANSLNTTDYAVIEQALREAMNRGTDYQVMMQYRDVLTKLQGYPSETGAFSMEQTRNQSAELDGFRYDYDDNAGL
ncbi:hypothetical protein [Marinicrinis sediminis]|uniref:Uncharacterized protein n=1 Tax=Marinicrinis sediminis TaxID=1652465 RepID=A0ABW5RD88_9BACL